MLRLFELPEELQTEASAVDDIQVNAGVRAELDVTLACREATSIYDYAWFPGMDSNDAATCCFLSSSRDQPLHLWDAYTAQCRASYVAYNHLDEITSAHSVAFDPSGSKIYAGFERAIRVFDVGRPGRHCDLRPTCATKRSREGQRGIISCFAFAPDYWGLYAAGSYSGTTGLYDERDPSHLIVELASHGGGVTQATFSADGLYLFVGARRDGSIRMWDVRQSCAVLATFERRAPTNQRIGFELLGAASEGLLTASQDGSVLLYNTSDPAAPPTTLLTFGSATNTATRHPSLPMLAVAEGERTFQLSTGDARQALDEDGQTTTCESAAAGDESEDEDEARPRGSNGLSLWILPQQQALHDGAAGTEMASEAGRGLEDGRWDDPV